MKTILTTLLLTGLALGIRAGDDFSLHITDYPKQIPQGVRITVWTEARNTSGKPLVVGYNSHGFGYHIALRRLDGRPFGDDQQSKYCSPNGIPGRPTDRTLAITAPPGWSEKQRHDPECMDHPGDYALRITVSSTGPFYIWTDGKPPTGTITEKDIWRGELQSEEVIIRVIAPANEEDQLAFASLKGYMGQAWGALGSDLTAIWEHHPKSIYAGYALTDNVNANSFGGMIIGTTKEKVSAIEYQGGVRLISEIMIGAENFEERKHREYDVEFHDRRLAAGFAYFQNIVVNAEIFLKSHPDFPDADLVRIKMIQALWLLNRNKEARRLLEVIAQGDTPRAAEAKQVLLNWKD